MGASHLDGMKCYVQAWGSPKESFSRVVPALYPEDRVEMVLWVQTDLPS